MPMKATGRAPDGHLYLFVPMSLSLQTLYIDVVNQKPTLSLDFFGKFTSPNEP
jgi:hypothetical protein